MMPVSQWLPMVASVLAPAVVLLAVLTWANRADFSGPGRMRALGRWLQGDTGAQSRSVPGTRIALPRPANANRPWRRQA